MRAFLVAFVKGLLIGAIGGTVAKTDRRVLAGLAEGLVLGGAGWLLGFWAGWRRGRRELRRHPHDRYGLGLDDPEVKGPWEYVPSGGRYRRVPR